MNELLSPPLWTMWYGRWILFHKNSKKYLTVGEKKINQIHCSYVAWITWSNSSKSLLPVVRSIIMKTDIKILSLSILQTFWCTFRLNNPPQNLYKALFFFLFSGKVLIWCVWFGREHYWLGECIGQSNAIWIEFIPQIFSSSFPCPK